MLSEKVKVKGTDEIKPTVIFEVGVSEPYSDLQSDMYQWLTKSSDVQLVVLVDIKEDHKMRKTRWETPECKQRVNELLRDFGNAEGNAKHGRDESVAEDSPDEDARSNEDLYKSIKQAIEVDDWVGPIEVHVELWETGDQGPQKRGNRIVSRPWKDSVYGPPRLTIIASYTSVHQFSVSCNKGNRFGTPRMPASLFQLRSFAQSEPRPQRISKISFDRQEETCLL